MKVIISGVGQVGYHIAEKLAQEKHEITVIDSDPKAIDHISRVLDIDTVLGSGASPALLEAAGITKANLFLATSSVDEINITSCIVAKNLYKKANPGWDPDSENSPRGEGLTCIARVRSSEYNRHPDLDRKMFGVDVFINQDEITSYEIAQIIKMPGAVEVIQFAEKKVELVGFVVREKSLLVGRRIMGIRENKHFRKTIVVAVQRNDELIIPTGNTKIQTDDVMFFIGEKGAFKHVSSVFTGLETEEKRKKRVFVLGGGSFYENVNRYSFGSRPATQRQMDIKMVDSNLARTYQFSEVYPRNVFCLNGEATDLDLLQEEGIESADHVIAATPDEDTNIVASILCKEHGAKQTITIVQDPDYAKIKMMAGIDVAISPKILTSGEVLKNIRPDTVQKTAPLLEEGAEVLEIRVPDDGGRRFDRPISQLELPLHSIVGAVVRTDGHVIIPEGSTVIRPGDNIIVFVLPEAKEAVQKFFTVARKENGSSGGAPVVKVTVERSPLKRW